MNKFIHLHRHDQYSLFDGMGKAKDVAQFVAKIEQPAVALTNHGNVCGLLEHFKECNEVGIKPILGVEAYFVPKLTKKKGNYHLTIIAKNDEGYRNLMKLMSEANDKGFYYRPRIDKEMLEKHHKGLIILSGCTSGYPARMIFDGEVKRARKFINWLHSLLKDDFYIEVQAHNMNHQPEVNRILIDIAEALGIECVMTQDAHYTEESDYETQSVLRRFKSEFGGYQEAFIATRKQMLAMWERYTHYGKPKRYANNTIEIAEKCNVTLDLGLQMPEVDWGSESKKLLKQLAIKGLKNKGKWNDDYKEKLRQELKVIYGKHFEDYFLICWDIIKWCKENGIYCGFGRGSVGGSVLAYAIGITEVDPLIHNTVFERFLRPDKTTMPDIDMDFDSTRRKEIFEYIENRYPGRTAPIITFGKYKVRNLANELLKLFELDQDADEKKRIVKKLETIVGEEDPDYDTLMLDKDMRNLESEYKLITHFTKLFGQICYFGRHASGVAISREPINEVVGLMKSHNQMVTSFDKNGLEQIKVLKMDILGLETCSVFALAEKEIGKSLFSEKILKDKNVIKIFANGETDGVFQFEKDTAKEILRSIEPKTFDDVVAATALNRPAPLQLGMVDQFIEARNEHVDTDAPWYPMTEDTYGCVIYQEQVMKICRGLANMDWPDIDKVMKQLRKYDKSDELRKKFIKGVKKNGIRREQAEEIFDKMTQYLFNKAHGTAYTLISFYCAYLMHYYPLEYLYAMLAFEDDERKQRIYQRLAAGQGILVLLPHVNGSANFSITEFEGERCLQAGLVQIKGIGEKVAEEIISKGPYNCVELVEQRVPKRFFNSRVKEILEKQGALEFDKNKYLDRVVRYNAQLLNEFRRFHNA